MSRGKRSDKLPPALARRAYERREASRGAWQHHHSERFKDMEDLFKAQLDVALLECVDGRHADPGKRGERLLSMPFLLAATYRLVDEALPVERSEEHTSELQSLMRISYAVFFLKKKKNCQHII